MAMPPPVVGGGGQQEQWQERLSRALKMVVEQEQDLFDREAVAAALAVSPAAMPPAAVPLPAPPMVVPIMAGGGQVAKRKKKHFSEQEVQHLREGVQKYGVGNWANMLNDPALQFDETRNAVSLKDKWRNLMKAA